MKVGDLVRGKGAETVTVRGDATVAAAVRLMLERQVGGLPVVDATGRLIGFMSERDVVAALARQSGEVRQQPVASCMRQPPTCSADEPLRHVMARMTRERLRHIVVLDGARVAGIVSVGDIVKHRLEQLETEAGVLRDYVAGQRATG